MSALRVCPLPERSLVLSLFLASNGFWNCRRYARGRLGSLLGAASAGVLARLFHVCLLRARSRPRLGEYDVDRDDMIPSSG